MSEGSGGEQKPTVSKREVATSVVDRPKRQTRKEVDYSHSGEGSSATNQHQPQGAVHRELYLQSGLRNIRECSTESLWGSSDTSEALDCWSPRTVERRAGVAIEAVREVQTQLQHLKMAQKEEVSVTELMKMMLELNSRDKEEARKREIEREERAIEREDKRLREQADREEERRREDDRREQRRIEREAKEKEAAAEREVQLIATLKAAQPVVPQTVYLENTKLPAMTKGEDVELFLELFESALLAGNVPEHKWVQKLHAALDSTTKMTIRETITTPDVTYDEIKRALVGQTHLTFACASESLVTLENGAITKLPVRQAVQKMARYLDKISTEATTMQEMCLYTAVAILRVALSRDVKQYIDVKGSCDSNSFCCSLEEWQKTNPGRPIWESKYKSFNDRPVFSPRQPYRSPGQTRRVGECFHCGKMGHYAAECRSRLAGNSPAQPRQEGPAPAQLPTVTAEASRPGKQFQRPLAETTCFSCHQKGHISPNCPTKKSKVKKVTVQESKLESLKHNEVFGSVGPHRMPVTLDTGAEITVVPEEAVDPSQFTGDTCELRSFNNTKSQGRKCVVQVSAGKQTFTKQAVTQPGKSLGWSVCLSLDLSDAKEREFLMEQMTARASMPERLTLYIPPEVRMGFLVSGLPIEEARVVKVITQGDKLQDKEEAEQPEPLQSVESEAHVDKQIHDTVESGINSESDTDEVLTDETTTVVKEVVENEVEGEVLVDEKSLEMAEEDGESLGGRAEIEGSPEFPVNTIGKVCPWRK